MAEPAAVLVAARDEEGRIGAAVESLRAAFPGVPVIVADDGSCDGTAAEAEGAGALVLRLPHRGKGQALTLAERAAPPGPLLLCDADLVGDLRPLVATDADLAVAAFAERRGGGFGIAKRVARALTGAREPLSGQRALSERARAAVFPLAAGFGAEMRMTIDARRAGLAYEEVELTLEHRPTGRDLRGFLHRGRQLRDLLLAVGPSAVNHRGLRLPLVGWVVAATPTLWLRATKSGAPVAAVCLVGALDDALSGPERGFRGHLGSGRTTGTVKLVAIPAVGWLATRKLSGALLVGLAANAVNQLDTRPGRALKAYVAAAIPLRAPLLPAVLIAPYDLREMAMLGDAGANALGALLGLHSVDRLGGRGRWIAIGALAGLTLLGETRSLGGLIERTPGLRTLDELGRRP